MKNARTFTLPAWICDELKKENNQSELISGLLEDYYSRVGEKVEQNTEIQQADLEKKQEELDKLKKTMENQAEKEAEKDKIIAFLKEKGVDFKSERCIHEFMEVKDSFIDLKSWRKRWEINRGAFPIQEMLKEYKENVAIQEKKA